MTDATTTLTRAGRAGLPAELSLSAGAFVCNQVFFGLMHAAAKPGRVMRAGFVHVPALPAAAADQALMQLVRALEVVLRVTQRAILKTSSSPQRRKGKAKENRWRLLN